MSTMIRSILPMLAVALTLVVSPKLRAAQDEKSKYDPAVTTIAVLPCVDRSGEKAQEWRDRQAASAYRNLIEMFAERGFKIADKETIAKAIADNKLNLDDEEDYRRENFLKVGKAAGADLVAFAVVTQTAEGRKSKGILGGKEIQGRATVKAWLLDVKQESKIVSAEVREGKAAGNSKLFGNNEGRWRRVNAVGNALKEMLEEFLKPYKKIKDVKVSDDGIIQ